MNKKAIVLLSGGLDSILATRLMIELGVEVVPVHYYIEFAACGGGTGAAERAARILGVGLKIFNITEEYLEIFKNPRHGYGANINPCIDCKIFMLKKAKAYMGEAGASFLVTGEVLGERPMSQRRDALNLIEKQAGVREILLRPLTAKNLEPTIPEKEGIVDRERLLDIKGRGRKPQIALAAKFGIKEYPNPSGGCLLTDPGFTRRVRDLIAHDSVDIESLKLLKIGRHFRLGPKTKLVIGRDEKENDRLESLVKKGDIILLMHDHQGPFSILRGAFDKEAISTAASIVAYHTKFRHDNILKVDYWKEDSVKDSTTVSIEPAQPNDVEKVRV